MMYRSRDFTACLLLASLLVLVTDGRFVFTNDDIHPRPTDIFEKSDEILCPSLLSKPLTDLLVSEYNRVTTSNQRLYAMPRLPDVECRENDLSSCHVTLELAPTTCPRSASPFDCKPMLIAGESEKCLATINLISATVVSPLRCRIVGSAIPAVANDNLPMYRMDAEGGTLPKRMSPDSAIRMLKKSWEDSDGYDHPF